MRAAIRIVLAVLVPLLALAPSATPTGAAETTSLTAQELESLIERARDGGVEIIVVSPDAPESAGLEPDGVRMGGTQEVANAFRAEMRILASHIPDVLSDAQATLAATSPDGTASYFFSLVVGLIAVMFVAAAIEWFYGRWVKEKMRAAWPEAPANMPGKMTFLAVRFLVRLVGFGLFGLISYAIAAVVYDSHPAVDATGWTLLGTVIGVRIFIEFWRVWITPNLPAFRLPDLDDREASELFRWLVGSAVLGGGMLSVCIWMDALGIDERSHRLLLLMVGVVILIYHLVLLRATRHMVARLIAGPEAERARVPRLHRFAADHWHQILGAYFVAAWATSVVRIVLGNPDPIGPGAGMVFVLMATLTLFCLMVVVLDWFFYQRPAAKARRAAVNALALASAADDGAQESIEIEDDEEAAGGVRTFEDLAKQFGRILLFCFVIGGLLTVWGVDLADHESPVVRLWDVALIAALGYLAFQSARILIERRIEEEGGADEPEPGAEGSAGGASRLATLLPLFRNFVLITIAVIAAMIALSELGIDIAPLFAGAGVVGLAIGFGAQTLIRDIFSGAFFLFDDAFRRGEYIDIGDVQGTVERISMRSMQVRHHNGPLHTVPFGEIRYLTNFSRDWVMMKLKIRVTYDTDVERLRKLIKKLGQELLSHPEIGDKFLEPLKSQGVYSMDDSAMIVRLKFMTRPGDQFDVRKVVYMRIREIFEQQGIKFAHREVTVRLADKTGEETLTEDEKKELAGAVAPLIEQAAQPESKS